MERTSMWRPGGWDGQTTEHSWFSKVEGQQVSYTVGEPTRASLSLRSLPYLHRVMRLKWTSCHFVIGGDRSLVVGPSSALAACHSG